MLLWCWLIKNILLLSRLDIKPTGARQIQFDGREKWSDPTLDVQIDLSRLCGSTPRSTWDIIPHHNIQFSTSYIFYDKLHNPSTNTVQKTNHKLFYHKTQTRNRLWFVGNALVFCWTSQIFVVKPLAYCWLLEKLQPVQSSIACVTSLKNQLLYSVFLDLLLRRITEKTLEYSPITLTMPSPNPYCTLIVST